MPTFHARCIRITRTDNVEFGFTNCDRDITIAGLTYKANTAIEPQAIEQNVKLEGDNVTVRSILSNDAISERDILNGRYHNAKVVMAKINYLDPPNTLLEGTILLSGRVGKIEQTDTRFVLEIRGLSASLSVARSVKASPICRYTLGDPYCGVDLTNATYTGVITGIVNNRIIDTTINPDRGLGYGSLEFTSGNNQGLIYTIASNTLGNIHVLGVMQYPPAVGDSVRAIAGCRRDQWACRDDWDNFLNFGAEPGKWDAESAYFPGTDKLVFADRG
jgi:uncharacterized phage protein (TIGR02218 family)